MSDNINKNNDNYNNIYNNINTTTSATNTNYWEKNQSGTGGVGGVYTYILMFDDCTSLKEKISSKAAWDFIKQVAITGHSFGRGLAGSMFFTSTWDLEKLATVFNSMKMEFILFCVNDHSSSVRVTQDRQADIYKFFNTVLETIPVER